MPCAMFVCITCAVIKKHLWIIVVQLKLLSFLLLNGTLGLNFIGTINERLAHFRVIQHIHDEGTILLQNLHGLLMKKQIVM